MGEQVVPGLSRLQSEGQQMGGLGRLIDQTDII